MLSEAGNGGWTFGHRPSDFRMVIYREFETEQAFRRALAQIRERAGSRVHAREIPAPP
jgi:hypothetical protein